jgi:hypothetical protein
MSPLSLLKQIVTRQRPTAVARRNAHRGALNLESLEKRQVMAGNVSVAWANNTLRITGDSQDNQITLAEVRPGLIQIIGYNNTRINGNFANGNYFNKWSGNLSVTMGGGNDSVTIGWNGIPASRFNSLNVSMGAGKDTVEVKNTIVTGDNFSSFNLGDEYENDADKIDVYQSNFRALAIGTGGGDDRVYVGGSTATKAIINTGRGNDVAQLTNAAFADLAVSLGDGNDTVFSWNSRPSRSRWVHGGDGIDTLALGGEGIMSVHNALTVGEKFEHRHAL